MQPGQTSVGVACDDQPCQIIKTSVGVACDDQPCQIITWQRHDGQAAYDAQLPA
jgi:hypothetical protein